MAKKRFPLQSVLRASKDSMELRIQASDAFDDKVVRFKLTFNDVSEYPTATGAKLSLLPEGKDVKGKKPNKRNAGYPEAIVAIADRKPMLVPLSFGLARFKAAFLQFAPGAFKLTPDQVTLLERDNVVSEAARAAGLTLEGLGIAADSLEAIAPQYLWRFRAAGQFQRKSA